MLNKIKNFFYRSINDKVKTRIVDTERLIDSVRFQ